MAPFDEAVYDDCWGHHLGYARVRKGKGYGMVDNRGNEVIPCEYDYVDYIGKKRFAVKKDGMYSLGRRRREAAFRICMRQYRKQLSG